METISITGSSCFIGKHLVRVLTKQNYNLNLLSRNNLSTSTDKKNYINFDLNKKYKKVHSIRLEIKPSTLAGWLPYVTIVLFLKVGWSKNQKSYLLTRRFYSVVLCQLVQALLTKHYKLEEINAALNDLESGRVFRPLIVMDHGE